MRVGKTTTPSQSRGPMRAQGSGRADDEPTCEGEGQLLPRFHATLQLIIQHPPRSIPESSWLEPASAGGECPRVTPSIVLQSLFIFFSTLGVWVGWNGCAARSAPWRVLPFNCQYDADVRGHWEASSQLERSTWQTANTLVGSHRPTYYRETEPRTVRQPPSFS
jgi:hypothetical protein